MDPEDAPPDHRAQKERDGGGGAGPWAEAEAQWLHSGKERGSPKVLWKPGAAFDLDRPRSLVWRPLEEQCERRLPEAVLGEPRVIDGRRKRGGSLSPKRVQKKRDDDGGAVLWAVEKDLRQHSDEERAACGGVEPQGCI
ncbi:hypothetical protein NDU88_000993 [Pleurodeles waltl]|uniref:Uncharacterized protein n=1 Tax=Pleurodeles waltl TaxID=8319 RepID=A0AAV7MJ67_PLEWA|nr:hypothetical protein NDU88_000993 [Pleurodeles waltl]